MSGSPSRQYGAIAISISDCQRMFNLNNYTPEQIVDVIFTTAKTRPVSKEAFAQNFKHTFEKNVTVDSMHKVEDGITRIFEICAQNGTTLNVDQLGKGVGVFTTRRETGSLLRDLFFYLDREFRSIVTPQNVNNFLQEVASKGINRNISKEINEFYELVVKEKGNPELSYWGFYIWRNHPALVALVSTYKEFQDRRALTQSQIGFSAGSFPNVNQSPVPQVQTQNINLQSSQVHTRGPSIDQGFTVDRPAQAEQGKKSSAPAPTTGAGDASPLSPFFSRSTNKLKSFDEFLELGAKLGMTAISAKDFIRRSREYFASHKKAHHDMFLHEFIRMCIEMFKPESYPYYDYVESVVKLFQFLDLNDNGILEVNEALQGIIHLFSDTQEDKLIAAFMLFDQDNSGFIDFNEIYDFIYSTIRLTKHTGSVAMTEQAEQELKDVAYATATDLFSTIDVDHSGQITLEEFLVWYRATGGEVKPVEVAAAKALKEQKVKEFEKKVEAMKNKKIEKTESEVKAEQFKKEIEDTKADIFIVEDIRSKIPFDRIHIQVGMEFMKNELVNETVNFSQFEKFLSKLIKNQGLPGQEYVHEVSKILFNALDENKNSLLELSEIATGLGLLLGGNQIEKIKAGFDLFDDNSDKVLNFEELQNFMGAFFKIIRSNNPNLNVYNQDPLQYALALTIVVFQECNIPFEGAIDFPTFKDWVVKVNKEN